MGIESVVDWIGVLIGLLGLFYGAYIRFYDRKNMRKATLYYPLFLACRGIIEVIKDYDILGDNRSRDLFLSSIKTLDAIVYEYGSIIHLKKADEISAFLSMKKLVDEQIEFVERRNWVALRNKFASEEFRDIESYAETLLSKCKKEVKELNNLSE